MATASTQTATLTAIQLRLNACASKDPQLFQAIVGVINDDDLWADQ